MNSTSGGRHRYEAHLFGPFQVLRDGTRLGSPTWGRASARTLLKWFLLNPGDKFREGELAQVLWPGRKGGTANRLHVTQHSLRRVLQPELCSRQPSAYVRSDACGRCWFDPAGNWWTDVDEVARLTKTARAAQAADRIPEAIGAYERLLAHYERGFLPEEVYLDAFEPFRVAHGRDHDEALRQLLRLNRRGGRHWEALTYALRVLDRDPYAEEAAAAAVEIHLRQGSITAALAQLESVTRALREDLGVPLGPELLALRERVRQAR
ncbi:hypothetical protein GCM10027160_08960 [Streptomyces calidiresistens]|uniref:AfsR/SARP family transcriptional regulator n=1 Tax=Streptomyces calidiresistens TaxID=1485586 RepID=UPI0015F802D7|nr:BTAD domain-containing putative transcriptional regulator [Streptomyces calidiresistens]